MKYDWKIKMKDKRNKIAVIIFIVGIFIISIGILSKIYDSKNSTPAGNTITSPFNNFLELGGDGEVYKFLTNDSVYESDQGEEIKLGTYQYDLDNKTFTYNHNGYDGKYTKKYTIAYYDEDILILKHENEIEEFYREQKNIGIGQLHIDKYYEKVNDDLTDGYYYHIYEEKYTTELGLVFTDYKELNEIKFLSKNKYQSTRMVCDYCRRIYGSSKSEKESGSYKIYKLKDQYKILNEIGGFINYEIILTPKDEDSMERSVFIEDKGENSRKDNEDDDEDMQIYSFSKTSQVENFNK